MTIVRYTRAGGFPPPDDEALDVGDDGSYTLVRTNGSARVGRFTGRLEASDVERLRSLASAAEAAGDQLGPAVPDAAFETVRVGAVSTTFAGRAPEGPWVALAGELARLVDTLTPPTGSGLALKPGAGGARLLVVGDEPQDVDLASLTGGVASFTADGALGERAGLATAPDRGPQRWTTLAPGQPVDVGYASEVPVEPGGRLQVEVRLAGRRDGRPVLYRLLAVRNAAPPAP